MVLKGGEMWTLHLFFYVYKADFMKLYIIFLVYASAQVFPQSYLLSKVSQIF